jgi:hypothetical protein
MYLQPIKQPRTDIWFTNAPIGKNTLGNIAKTMFASTGLKYDRKTNHSGRKTAIQNLLYAGIAPTDVQQLSGHRNVQSLNAYSTLSSDQQHKLSTILSSSIQKSVSVAPSNKPLHSTSTASASAAVVSVTSDNTTCNDDNYILFADYFANDDMDDSMDMTSTARQQKRTFDQLDNECGTLTDNTRLWVPSNIEPQQFSLLPAQVLQWLVVKKTSSHSLFYLMSQQSMATLQ